MFRFHYLCDHPIVSVEQFPELGGNINGPSLIAAPAWLQDPPARYLLYFAHHEGSSIRLACSDQLAGPWRIQAPPPLLLEHSLFACEPVGDDALDPQARAFIEAGADGNYAHIASPEVRVDHAARRIRLYYHGRLKNGLQRTRVALSLDGLEFSAQDTILADPYLRVFESGGWTYGLAMPAKLYRSRDGLCGFETGPCLTEEPIRHHALLRHEDYWYLFWTRVGDDPERILVSPMVTDGDWEHWRLGPAVEVHRAQRSWEGADVTSEASSYGAVVHRVNQLRDPAIFEEDGRIYLLYAIAGEQGIAIGELEKT